MLDLIERVSLDAVNLPFALYLPPIKIPTPSNYGNPMFLEIGVI